MNDQKRRRNNGRTRTSSNGSDNNIQGRAKNVQNKYSTHRQSNGDQVRKIVQEEGRTARNLIQFNVPVSEEFSWKNSALNTSSNLIRKSRCTSTDHIKINRRTSSVENDSVERNSNNKSMSTTKNDSFKDVRARYWAFLFENLKRAVDEIYDTCEVDESVLECKEVIMMLEQYTKDFKDLIYRLNLLRDYESAEEGSKPKSVAWEVRKSSPGKKALMNNMKENIQPSYKVLRSLNPIFNAITVPSHMQTSWADKVKNTVSHDIKSVDELIISNGINNNLFENECDKIENYSLKAKDNSISVSDDKQICEMIQNNCLDIAACKKVDNVDEANMWQTVTNHKNTHAKISRNDKLTNSDHNYNHDLDRKVMSSTPELAFVAKESINFMKMNLTLDLKPQTFSSTQSMEALSSDNHDSIEENTEYSNLCDKSSDDINNSWNSDDGKHDLFSSDDEREDNDDSESQFDKDEIKLKTSNDSVCTEDNSLSDLGADIEIKNVDGNEHLSSEQVKCDATKEIKVPGMCWSDIMEQEDRAEARTPGRSVHMHEKLSSPSRKRSPMVSHKRFEEKLSKAEALREKHLQDIANRSREVTEKIVKARGKKEERINQKRIEIDSKMLKAEETRKKHLKFRIQKAQDEEQKVNEISFINTLTADNKKHEIESKHAVHEARLHDIAEEKQKRQEEKFAKEAAVEERRKALSAERTARLQEVQKRRMLKEKEIELKQMEKEKERIETARIKQQEKDLRITALNTQQQAHIEELTKKIQLKQEESERRNHENLEQIREKAFQSSILKHSKEDHHDAPTLGPYQDKKICSVCNVMIPSEVHLMSHLRGKKHKSVLADQNGGKEPSLSEIEAFNIENIQDAPSGKMDPRISSNKERQKSLKKRCKKLRQRMTQRGSEYENSTNTKSQVYESEHKSKIIKLVKDMNKHLNKQESGPWTQTKEFAFERILGELGRILDRKQSNTAIVQNIMRVCGGLTALVDVFKSVIDSTGTDILNIPSKVLTSVCTVLRLACRNSYDNSHYMLFSNKIGIIIDFLGTRLDILIPDGFSIVTDKAYPICNLSSSLLELISCILKFASKKFSFVSVSNNINANQKTNLSEDAFILRCTDCISYIISVGIVDRLAVYFQNVHGSVDDQPDSSELIQHGISLLAAMTKTVFVKSKNIFDGKIPDDSTKLLLTFQTTDLTSIVSLLYGVLLYNGAPSYDAKPSELPNRTINLISTALHMLNNLAIKDLQMLQKVIGGEGTWLEFRHIANYILWYFASFPCPEMVHELIICVGYFAVLNNDNQMVLQGGMAPTVLQQLCSLPFSYFSDPKLVLILFPTLISCCYNCDSNREILEQELSCQLLANFLEEKELEQTIQNFSPEKQYKECSFSLRFPQDEIKNAHEYFLKSY